jgi:hypothetical protein
MAPNLGLADWHIDVIRSSNFTVAHAVQSGGVTAGEFRMTLTGTSLVLKHPFASHIKMGMRLRAWNRFHVDPSGVCPDQPRGRP